MFWPWPLPWPWPWPLLCARASLQRAHLPAAHASFCCVRISSSGPAPSLSPSPFAGLDLGPGSGLLLVTCNHAWLFLTTSEHGAETARTKTIARRLSACLFETDPKLCQPFISKEMSGNLQLSCFLLQTTKRQADKRNTPRFRWRGLLTQRVDLYQTRPNSQHGQALRKTFLQNKCFN
jgi:hypothetical protein